jgi:bloom syndrome protein
MLKSDAKTPNRDARLRSLQALALYCENTDACRHAQICNYFGHKESVECDFACDWHKDPQDLERRFRGLADEEWVSTQAMQGTYDVEAFYEQGDDYEGYSDI